MGFAVLKGRRLMCRSPSMNTDMAFPAQSRCTATWYGRSAFTSPPGRHAYATLPVWTLPVCTEKQRLCCDRSSPLYWKAKTGSARPQVHVPGEKARNAPEKAGVATRTRKLIQAGLAPGSEMHRKSPWKPCQSVPPDKHIHGSLPALRSTMFMAAPSLGPGSQRWEVSSSSSSSMPPQRSQKSERSAAQAFRHGHPGAKPRLPRSLGRCSPAACARGRAPRRKRPTSSRGSPAKTSSSTVRTKGNEDPASSCRSSAQAM
mmetsp:Transcript_21937/g.46628  ORF Transcript_21937/g.46628 Transcript_21937/m.46628 type:complete len:259 (-) Transcript_21937:69-845(-)